MSVRALRLFCEKVRSGDMAGLNTSDRMVLYSLCMREGEDNGICYHSRGTIAKDAGCSLSTVKNSIKKLAAAGYIHIVSGMKFAEFRRKTRSNTYIIFPDENALSDDREMEIYHRRGDVVSLE